MLPENQQMQEQAPQEPQTQAQNEPDLEGILEELAQGQTDDTKLWDYLEQIEEEVAKVEDPEPVQEQPQETARPEPDQSLAQQDSAKDVKPLDTSEVVEQPEALPEPQADVGNEDTKAQTQSEPQSPYQELLEQFEKDPVLRQLAELPEQDRIAVAMQMGNEGIAKLLQLQKLEMLQMIEQAKLEANKPTLDMIVQSWAQQHQDLLQDPDLAEIAKGLELSYLAKLGKSSYLELHPVELKQMLKFIEDKLYKLRGGSQPKADDSQPSQRTALGVGDLGGGTPPQQSQIEVLQRLAEDPLKLEKALEKLSPDQIDNLLAELE